MRPRLLVITPVRHIRGVVERLESACDVTYLEEATADEVLSRAGSFEAIFTNPNKSQVFLGPEIMGASGTLKVICTASTGTNHIDKKFAAERGIAVLSLTEQRDVINRISSTAELAFALTMAQLRNVVSSHAGALAGEWDYTKYIGRQMNALTVGVVGYGRLGSLYASYCSAFGAKVIIYDPYKTVARTEFSQVSSLDELLTKSDVISLHVHVSPETTGMINESCFARMKPDVLLINTARGEIVDEHALVRFLREHPEAKAGVDVLASEITNRAGSPLLQYAKASRQVVITQHIGGMTREAQEIAYGHAAQMLVEYFASASDLNKQA